MKTRIFVVDDHPIMFDGLAEVTAREPDLEFCGCAPDPATALRELDARPADLVIVDLSLNGASGFDLIKDLQCRHPRLRILVLSLHEDPMYVELALKAGAHGYITKTERPSNIVLAIRRVRDGGTYITPAIAELIAARTINNGAGRHDQPTDRELQVLEMLGRGCETWQISAALHISVSTVQTYCDRLKGRLGVHTERELICVAARWQARHSGV